MSISSAMRLVAVRQQQKLTDIVVCDEHGGVHGTLTAREWYRLGGSAVREGPDGEIVSLMDYSNGLSQARANPVHEMLDRIQSYLDGNPIDTVDADPVPAPASESDDTDPLKMAVQETGQDVLELTEIYTDQVITAAVEAVKVATANVPQGLTSASMMAALAVRAAIALAVVNIQPFGPQDVSPAASEAEPANSVSIAVPPASTRPPANLPAMASSDRAMVERCVAGNADATSSLRGQYTNLTLTDSNAVIILDKAHGHIDDSLPLGYDPGASFIRIDSAQGSSYALAYHITQALAAEGMTINRTTLQTKAEQLFARLLTERRSEGGDRFFNADTEVIRPLMDAMGFDNVNDRGRFYRAVWRYADQNNILLSEAAVSDALVNATAQELQSKGYTVWVSRPDVSELGAMESDLSGRAALRSTMADRVSLALTAERMNLFPVLIAPHLDVASRTRATSAAYTVNGSGARGVTLGNQELLARSIAGAWKQGVAPETAPVTTEVRHENLAVPRCSNGTLLEAINLASAVGRARAYGILTDEGTRTRAAQNLEAGVTHYLSAVRSAQAQATRAGARGTERRLAA